MINTDLKNKHVLILEDSTTQALSLKETLEKNQFIVHISKNGVEGLEKIKDKLPDIIISDIGMPEMDGYEFCKQIRSYEEYNAIPVILLTSLTNPLDVIKGINCGADGFLAKPCDSDILITTIQNTVKNVQLKNKYPRESLTLFFGDQAHSLTINQIQVIELLLSTYSGAIQKNKELEKAYRELEEKNKKLRELDEKKNYLLGIAAHDLKNPLAVISALSSFLLHHSKIPVDAKKSHEMIKRIDDSSTFMLEVIDDILDFAAIESGTLILHLSEVNLPELIQKDMLFFESLAEVKGVSLEFNYKKPIPLIRCDPNKISQVINNLIINGSKFSHPKGVLELSLESSEHEITISIKDSGVGMSEEALLQLFQPFSETRTKGTVGEKGTGLGLFIARKIVQAHHGKIWAESQLDKGSVFHVSLPLNVT